MSDAQPEDGGNPRVVVVTGASSGIGRATAVLLSGQGMRVVLASRSRESLVSAQGECLGGETLVVPTDVSKADEVDALLDAAVARFGRVDAVVHSAAVLAYGRFEDVPADVFAHILDVTVVGTANVARAALRRFQAQGGGRLVVVGSLLGKIATPYMSSYVTAKWAVHGLVRCLQIEARDTPGVEVSLVSPGGVNTPVYRQAGTYAGHHGMPPPPVVSPERVARAIARRLDRPARDTDVGPANLLTVLGFRVLPGVFDLIVTPLMKAGGLQRAATGPTTGNVLEPTVEGESTHGPWPTVFGGIFGGGGVSPLDTIGRLRWRRT
ncbi:MAG: SDR family NAD(P)-dependent oxidoreductase [Actinomycetota bacterium]|nr:SDR family NAD(P)-dependent oxidoreductase [Actinomycetota bacterium]